MKKDSLFRNYKKNDSVRKLGGEIKRVGSQKKNGGVSKLTRRSIACWKSEEER